jgi:hypothetical protein
MADRRTYLPRVDLPGRRLGRHVNHDPRSLSYLVAGPAAAVTPKSVKWDRHVPSFDQGDLGSCTINAGLGILATDPYWGTLPKEMQQSLAAGNIQELLHATSLAACHEAIQKGPFMIGITWYQNMFYPNADGIVSPGGAVAGGHEIECNEYDLSRDLWWFPNSWSPGWGKDGRFAMTSATFQNLLAQQGDATSLVPITAPAPVPIDPPKPIDPLSDFPYVALDRWSASARAYWTKTQRDAAAAYSAWRSVHK